MNRYVAAVMIAVAVVWTFSGHPAYGIIPLGIMIAINGQDWTKK